MQMSPKVPHGHRDEWPTDHSEYPRKQFRRDNWLNLNGKWKFAFDTERKCRNPRDVKAWPLEITVPFVPECEASGIADQGFHPSCWYERTFQFHPQKNGRVLLHFGAVDYSARVWVNDQYVGEHEGGHTPFCFDITDVLAAGGEQKMTVWVLDDPQDLAKPRGKQDWQLNPHSIWYPRSTGIWQTVWIEEVPPTYLDYLNWSPHLERWEIGLEAFVVGPARPGLQLKVRLNVEGRLLAHDTYEVVEDEVLLVDPQALNQRTIPTR